MRGLDLHGWPELWDAINQYVAACGGDTSERTVSAERMDAVAAVERAITALDTKCWCGKELNHPIRTPRRKQPAKAEGREP